MVYRRAYAPGQKRPSCCEPSNDRSRLLCRRAGGLGTQAFGKPIHIDFRRDVEVVRVGNAILPGHTNTPATDGNFAGDSV